MYKLALAVTFAFVGWSGAKAQLQTPDAPQPAQILQAEPASLIRFTGAIPKPYRDTLPKEVSITFSLFAEEQDVGPLWSETQNVNLDAVGRFSVLLGVSTPNGLPAELFANNQARWLGYRVEGVPETARKLLVGVPYALKAREAESLNGLPASSFVRWSDLQLPIPGATRSISQNPLVVTASPNRPAAPRGDSGNKTRDAGDGARDTYLPGNLLLPLDAYIATPDINIKVEKFKPKLFLSAPGGPGGGVVPSLTFRSTNPRHVFGEVAFQDSTPVRGQDIWAMQQDFQFTHTENLTFRRRGQQVMTFWPLSQNGSDVLTTLSGTRFRFERSGPYPVEWRDTSFSLPKGLWRMMTSGDCWFLDKNQAASGDFAQHTPMLETCGDGNLNVAAGLNINGGVNSFSDLNLQALGRIILSTLAGRSIYFNPGPQGYNLFLRPIGIGTDHPESMLHISGTGNLQDAIFAAQGDTNEGISIRNSTQNWALGVRADMGEALVLRNITNGQDVLAVARNGDLMLAPGAKVTAGGSTLVAPSTPEVYNSLKHSRMEIPPLAPGEITLVKLDWKVAFTDANYTATCSVVNPSPGEALRIAHLQNIQPDAVSVVVVNGDVSNSQSGVLNCIAVHD